MRGSRGSAIGRGVGLQPRIKRAGLSCGWKGHVTGAALASALAAFGLGDRAHAFRIIAAGDVALPWRIVGDRFDLAREAARRVLRLQGVSPALGDLVVSQDPLAALSPPASADVRYRVEYRGAPPELRQTIVDVRESLSEEVAPSDKSDQDYVVRAAIAAESRAYPQLPYFDSFVKPSIRIISALSGGSVWNEFVEFAASRAPLLVEPGAAAPANDQPPTAIEASLGAGASRFALIFGQWTAFGDPPRVLGLAGRGAGRTIFAVSAKEFEERLARAGELFSSKRNPASTVQSSRASCPAAVEDK